MKPLVCDLCGGQLIMDDSREFAVCEYCRTKYMKSTLQAKVQEIRGTVKVEGDVPVRASDFTIRAGVLEKYNGSDVNVVVPDGVKEIHPNAFAASKYIKTVKLPYGVVKIDNAFQGCSSLETINIPNSVTSIDGTFRNCTSLQRINIPDSVTSIINCAFAG